MIDLNNLSDDTKVYMRSILTHAAHGGSIEREFEATDIAIQICAAMGWIELEHNSPYQIKITTLGRAILRLGVLE